MEYKLVKRSEAFDKLLKGLESGDIIYVVRVSRCAAMEDQWVRFYYIFDQYELEDITAEIAALFDLTMVYGEPACRVDGDDDEALIKLIEQLSTLLFDFPTSLNFCRL
jgi:hypothetical protein